MTDTLFPVAILAGGLATRLRPLTEKIPKALIEINGEAFIVHQLRLLKAQAISRVLICGGFLGEQIESLIGNGQDFGLEVNYSFDGEALMGTAGALKKALPLLGDNFFVLYGDSYLPCSFQGVQASFVEQCLPGLMTVFHNNGQWDQSNVEFFGGKIAVYDKHQRTPSMSHIDYGLGVFNQKAFDAVPINEPYDLARLYQGLLTQGQLAAFEAKERFYEIGSFAGISELEQYLKKES